MFLISVRSFIFIGILHYCGAWQCQSNSITNPEIRLKKQLLCGNYDHEERPDNGTTVKIDLHIKSFDFNDFNSEVTVRSFLGMIWYDHRLKWDPESFDNIKRLVIDEHDLWMPQLYLFNSPNTNFEDNCAALSCDVTFSGSVSCIPSCKHNAFCKTDYKNWPFDIQNCTFHMGSWMNSGNQIHFIEQQTNIDRSAIKHNEFKIIKIKARNNIGKYKGVNDTYPSIHYNIIIERHAATNMAFVFAPAIIFAILNLSLLWLSPNCGERIFICILSIFLHFLILDPLAFLLPKNGEDVPVVVIYFRDSLIIGTILLVETIICRGLLLCKKTSPQWMKTILDSLKGHKVGQFMFENPYLMNNVSNMQAEVKEHLTNDSANLVDNEAGSNKIESITNPNSNDNIWFLAVKFLDTLLFFILIICYIVMIIGWFPDVKSDYLDEKTVSITNDTIT